MRRAPPFSPAKGPRAAAALLVAFAAWLAAPSGHAAAAQCAEPTEAGVPVVDDGLIRAYALVRARGGAVEIAVNDAAAAGLGRQTKAWLFERACILAARAGGDPATDPRGTVVFSLIDHQDADCEAFQRVAARDAGARNALSVIDRDVSAKARGSYWDDGMGELRSVAADDCL